MSERAHVSGWQREERVKVSVRSREVRVGLAGVRRCRVLVTWGPCSPYSERRRFVEGRD